MKVGTVFKYTSERSAYKDSRIDLALGFANAQAGATRSFASFPCLCIVADDHGNGYVGMVEDRVPAEDAIWKTVDPSAPAWKNVYRVKPLTPVMPIPDAHMYRNVHPQFMSTEDRLELTRKMLRTKLVDITIMLDHFIDELK